MNIDLELLRPVNLTPYTVIVFSGRAHWHKPVEELEESFCTRKEAEDYVETIKHYRPEYFCQIIAE